MLNNRSVVSPPHQIKHNAVSLGRSSNAIRAVLHVVNRGVAWHGGKRNVCGAAVFEPEKTSAVFTSAGGEGCSVKNACTQQSYEEGSFPPFCKTSQKWREGGWVSGREGQREEVTASLYFSVSIAMRFNFRILQGRETSQKVCALPKAT